MIYARPGRNETRGRRGQVNSRERARHKELMKLEMKKPGRREHKKEQDLDRRLQLNLHG